LLVGLGVGHIEITISNHVARSVDRC